MELKGEGEKIQIFDKLRFSQPGGPISKMGRETSFLNTGVY